ncbi:DUF1376 domain-containing protein [Labrys portucalensis]|uniref:DUF1376 domain-containing protein n=1 Tax=Labrys neptuniae TaxID=376174 RepID=A0ABV6Z9C2_9HYPH
MPLYVADYLSATSHLNAAESGAYLHLIMHYWQKGKLPNDDRLLARIAKMSEREWAKSKPVIAEFFDENWIHARIEGERALAEENIEKKAKAGAAGGRAKALKYKEAPLADANFLPEQKHESASSKNVAEGSANRWQTSAPSPSPSPVPNPDSVQPDSPKAQAGSFWDGLEKRLCDAAAPMPLGTNPDISAMSTMLDNGFSLELDILPAIEAAKRTGKRFSTWDRMVGWVEQQNAGRKKAEGARPTIADKPTGPKPEPTERQLIKMARQYIERGNDWPFNSPPPGAPGTSITPEILEIARAEVSAERQRRARPGEAA